MYIYGINAINSKSTNVCNVYKHSHNPAVTWISPWKFSLPPGKLAMLVLIFNDYKLLVTVQFVFL